MALLRGALLSGTQVLDTSMHLLLAPDCELSSCIMQVTPDRRRVGYVRSVLC